jgi:hypothetical protein
MVFQIKVSYENMKEKYYSSRNNEKKFDSISLISITMSEKF